MVLTVLTCVIVILSVAIVLASAEDASGPSHTKCVSTFVSYTPSPLEKKWAENVEQWQLKVCEHINNAEMDWWIKNVTALMADNNGSAVVTDSATPPQRDWSWVFPVFTYRRVCHHKTDGSSVTDYVHIPIEPTAGLARDPRKVRNWCDLVPYPCDLDANVPYRFIHSVGTPCPTITRNPRRT